MSTHTLATPKQIDEHMGDKKMAKTKIKKVKVTEQYGNLQEMCRNVVVQLKKKGIEVPQTTIETIGDPLPDSKTARWSSTLWPPWRFYLRGSQGCRTGSNGKPSTTRTTRCASTPDRGDPEGLLRAAAAGGCGGRQGHSGRPEECGRLDADRWAPGTDHLLYHRRADGGAGR